MQVKPAILSHLPARPFHHLASLESSSASQNLSAHLPEAFRGVLRPLPASPVLPSDPRARVVTVSSSGSSSDLEAPWGLGLGRHRGDSGVFVK